MKRILNSSMPASRSFSSFASVTSSLHLEDDLAGLLVDDVVRGDLADELLEVDRQAIDLRRRWSFLIAALVNLVFFLTMTSLPTLMSRVARWPARRSNSTLLAYLPPFSRYTVFGVVEVVEQVLRRVAERAQQHRRVHLPAAVDADVT